MRIKEVTIKNYRSIKEITLSFEQYTALIGTNGAGKSSVLYALDWFFGGRGIAKSDYHVNNIVGSKASENKKSQTAEIEEEQGTEVTVTFDQLGAEEKNVFEYYLLNGNLVIRKNSILKPSVQFKSSLPLVFRDVFEAADYSQSAAKNKIALSGYERFIASASYIGLLPLNSANETMTEKMSSIKINLIEWAGRNSHKSKEEQQAFLPSSDLIEKLDSFITFILVPAISDDTEFTSEKSPALLKLLSTHRDIALDNEDSIEKANIAKERDREKEKHINQVLGSQLEEEISRFLPTRQSIAFSSKIVRRRTELRGSFSLGDDGVPLNQQGHGVQRAVLIALLKVSKTSESFTTILAIEEPEVYQHPIRVKYLADVLLAWSKDHGNGNRQLICATHSPYFILPTEFSSIRLFSLDADNCTVVRSSTLQDIQNSTQKNAAYINNTLLKHLPNQFSDAFFSEVVVLVEGDTDVAILEGLALHNLGTPDALGITMACSFASLGISVIPAGGNGDLKIYAAILKSLGIPVYVVFDSDFHVISKNPSTTYTITSEYLGVEKDFVWGKTKTTVVTNKFCIFDADIESELSNSDAFYNAWYKAKDSHSISAQSQDLNDIPESATDDREKLEAKIEEARNRKYSLAGQNEAFYAVLKSDKDAFNYKIAAQGTQLEPQSKFLELFNAIIAMLANKGNF